MKTITFFFTLLFVTTSLISQAQGTRVFYDGFENGFDARWQNDGAVITTSQPYAGTASAQGNWNGEVAWNDDKATDGLYLNTWPYTQEFLVRFWIRIDVDFDDKPGSKLFRLPWSGNKNGNEIIWGVQRGANAPPSVSILVNNNYVANVWNCFSLDDNQWHKMEIYIKDATNGQVSSWFDDQLMTCKNSSNIGIQFTGNTRENTAGWNEFHWLSNWSNNAGWEHDANNHVYLDDFEVYSDATTGDATTGSMTDGTIEVSTVPSAPAITSTLNKSVSTCSAFTYSITASQNPTSYSASPLPGWLTFNASTGVLSGTPTVAGTYSVNLGASNSIGTGTAVLVITTSSTNSVWSEGDVPVIAASADNLAVELGVKFRSDIPGEITGIRFYKGAGNNGTHIGNLWTTTGTNLGTVTFTSETASGWQQADFSTPIAITAGTIYVASYYAPEGHYAGDANGLASAIDNAPLHTIANSESSNSVYVYATGGGFPTETFSAMNYWVDVVFNCTSVTKTEQGGNNAMMHPIISPNPFTESTTIDFTSIKQTANESLSFHLYNVLGKEVAAYDNIIENKLTLKKDFAEGIYYYKVTRGDENLATGKLIVQ